MLVQGIKQAIAETPEEEEDGDEADGNKGFSEGEFGCLCDLVIAHSQGALLPPLSRKHDVRVSVSLDGCPTRSCIGIDREGWRVKSRITDRAFEVDGRWG